MGSIARRLGWALVGVVVLVRFASLWWSGYSQEYGFLESYYSLLATSLEGDLRPRWWGNPIANTPPLYVWALSAWSRVSWNEGWLRVPSAVAWASTVVPVYRSSGLRGVLVWVSLPLAFVVGGKATPDASLSALVAWTHWSASRGWGGRYWLGLVAGVAVKPHATVLGLAGLRRGFVRVPVVLVLVALGVVFALSPYGAFLWAHVASRWPGYWNPSWLVVALGSGVGAALWGVPFARGSWRDWGFLGLGLVFVLYAAPDFGSHEYYLAPLLPMVAIVVGRCKSRALLTLIVVGNLWATGWTCWENGDLWDRRVEELADRWPLSDAEPGLGTVGSWYEGQQLGTRRDGVLLAWEEDPACRVLEEAPARSVEDHSLWALDCRPGAAYA